MTDHRNMFILRSPKQWDNGIKSYSGAPVHVFYFRRLIEKKKSRLLRPPYCPCVSESYRLNFWTRRRIFTLLGNKVGTRKYTPNAVYSDAFASLRNIYQNRYVRPSLRPYITTRKPTIDATIYFILEYFTRNCPAFQFWIKSVKHNEHRLPNVQRPTNHPTRRTKGNTNYAPTAFIRGFFRLYYTVFYRNMPLILQSSSVTYTRHTANLSLRRKRCILCKTRKDTFKRHSLMLCYKYPV